MRSSTKEVCSWYVAKFFVRVRAEAQMTLRSALLQHSMSSVLEYHIPEEVKEQEEESWVYFERDVEALMMQTWDQRCRGQVEDRRQSWGEDSRPSVTLLLTILPFWAEETLKIPVS